MLDHKVMEKDDVSSLETMVTAAAVAIEGFNPQLKDEVIESCGKDFWVMVGKKYQQVDDQDLGKEAYPKLVEVKEGLFDHLYELADHNSRIDKVKPFGDLEIQDYQEHYKKAKMQAMENVRESTAHMIAIYSYMERTEDENGDKLILGYMNHLLDGLKKSPTAF